MTFGVELKDWRRKEIEVSESERIVRGERNDPKVRVEKRRLRLTGNASQELSCGEFE